MPSELEQLRRNMEALENRCRDLQSALERSEDRFTKIFHSSSNPMTITRMADGCVLDLNDASAALGGFAREELIGASPARKGLWADTRQRDMILQKIKEEGSVRNERVEFLGKGGEVHQVVFSANPILYNDEPCLLSVAMDITHQLKESAALRESEERFRLITHTIDEIFYIFDAEKGTALYLSPAFERIWGFTPDKALNRKEPVIDPVHPEDREKVMNWGPMLKSAKKPFSYEYRIIREDGSIRYIWDQGYPISEKNGEVKLFVGTGRDVTEWRLAEEALRESREYLHQIINGIGDPIIVKDQDHKLVLVNDAFCEFCGEPRESLLGTTGFEHFPQEMVSKLWKDEDEIFRTGQGKQTEDIISDGLGHTLTLMTKKSLLIDKNGNKQMILAIRDISEYKRLEAQFLQSQKMEAIGVLAGGVAHDFNNLLNVINGYSELLGDDLPADSPLREDVEQIRDAGRRAAALTSQLLAFGRKQILQPEILNLNQILLEMSSMLRRLIGEDIDLVATTHPDLGMIHADPAKIQQIILNLVVNARDAMPEGGKLTIETSNFEFHEEYIKDHPVTTPGSYIMLAISDNGAGMDAETQARIFEPFFTTKAKGKGTGLGLATVYGIVRQSNGYIWVYSEPGKGTAIKIYFPRAYGELSQAPVAKTDSSAFLGSETILVVEDEAAVRSLAVRLLTDRGYTVLEASQGADAVRIAREYAGDIHLVVTDVIMPGISGKAMVAQLQAERPDIKTLYISGYTDNAIVHHGILDSDVAFLQKPFSVESLARKVREVLDATVARGQ